MKIYRSKGRWLSEQRTKPALARAKDVLVWARTQGTETALLWAKKKLEKEFGLDMDLNPIEGLESGSKTQWRSKKRN